MSDVVTLYMKDAGTRLPRKPTNIQIVKKMFNNTEATKDDGGGAECSVLHKFLLRIRCNGNRFTYIEQENKQTWRINIMGREEELVQDAIHNNYGVTIFQLH